MSNDEIRCTVLRLLGNIAPEVDPSEIKAAVDFRDQIDVDSMDLQNFLISLYKEFGVDIPERDYPKLMTLNGCVGYLAAAQKRGKPA